jgi:hypothetical protein
MAARRSFLLLLLGVFGSMGASYRTTNFVVEAPTREIAQRVGQYAEHYRQQKAVQWLGREMPARAQPCPLQVTITSGGAGGATTFDYRGGGAYSQTMHIEGSLDRLLDSVLPHEITHTVFAYHFRRPVPRWADEGGSVLSEDDLERGRHDQLVRSILMNGHGIPLRRLFALKEYPSDVMTLYAEGFSVSDYLVGLNDRPHFLAFVADGMDNGWEQAVQSHYRFNSIDELEKSWINHLRETKETRRGPQFAKARPAPERDMEPVSRVVVRDTAPPVQPLSDSPRATYRGQAPSNDGWNDRNETRSDGRPAYLPDYRSGSETSSMRQDRWQTKPQRQSDPSAPSVRLGAPQDPSAPAASLGQPLPGHVSPAGYPLKD